MAKRTHITKGTNYGRGPQRVVQGTTVIIYRKPKKDSYFANR